MRNTLNVGTTLIPLYNPWTHIHTHAPLSMTELLLYTGTTHTFPQPLNICTSFVSATLAACSHSPNTANLMHRHLLTALFIPHKLYVVYTVHPIHIIPTSVYSIMSTVSISCTVITLCTLYLIHTNLPSTSKAH